MGQYDTIQAVQPSLPSLMHCLNEITVYYIVRRYISTRVLYKQACFYVLLHLNEQVDIIDL
jgi:hypothetical protein